MIGLENGVVRLSPYDFEWAQLYAAEKLLLTRAIGAVVLDIQHVGSTAIPGMLAKPIIDIGIAVEDFDRARACISPLQSLGYKFRGENGIPRRHYFEKGDPRAFHVHINEVTSRAWEDQVIFRDYLITHPEVASEYAALKTSLAALYPGDRDAYLEGKAPFIQRALEASRQGKR
jgi:GrpB-like predicted nucleotidyltransferase (UPF0157 family)